MKKGDYQLDFTYENSEIKHHISENFSEFTFIVYISFTLIFISTLLLLNGKKTAHVDIDSKSKKEFHRKWISNRVYNKAIIVWHHATSGPAMNVFLNSTPTQPYSAQFIQSYQI